MRAIIDRDSWMKVSEGLAARQYDLLGLWGEAATVHMALRERATGGVGIASLECPEGSFPSVARLHPPATRLERTAREFFGLEPEGARDLRPWLTHEQPYEFLPAEGEGLHRVPVGPVHAGIIEPGHFRFTVQGEIVVRLEARLGYTHKGVEGLMEGAEISAAAKLAGRVSGDSALAYAYAFALAAESALGVEAPPRAAFLRAIMAELERLANHLGDIGAVCNDAAFALMQARCALLREKVLRCADACFGHRLMRDVVIPGGAAWDLDEAGAARLTALVAEIRRDFPPLAALYDNMASLQDRMVGTGTVTPELAGLYAAGGHVGRASGRDFDARRDIGYAPYDRLSFSVPVLTAGDVDARVRIRMAELEQSLGLIEQCLAALPPGPVLAEMPRGIGEGLALVEGFRGDILVWLRLDLEGRVARCHLRDPSWFQWPLLEAAIEGNILADFPLCNKSFNCSYSGQDL
jgi:Ni,Fe-hydrogenase III large subunit